MVLTLELIFVTSRATTNYGILDNNRGNYSWKFEKINEILKDRKQHRNRFKPVVSTLLIESI